VIPILVLYIALWQLPRIVARLTAGARKPEGLAPIISKATTAAQRVLVSTSGEIAKASAKSETPAIIVIGEVVRFHEALDLGNRPSPRPSSRERGEGGTREAGEPAPDPIRG
jgi:uroporphyrin-III C-methyltransferase/precorrin-2 dehydrogenase/sirohydrochlorin ferrochelatase